jgi:lipopolysaccharide export system permease protein
MRLGPNLHDVYVGKVVLGTVLLVWSVLLGLDLMQTLLSELGDVGKGNYTFPHALAYLAYTVPRRAYTLFPTAAVIGALMGLGQLAASSELTALRALGLSRKRLSISVAVALALLTGLMVLSMETIGAWGESQAAMLKNTARSGNVAMARYSGLWAREGDVFLNAQTGDEVVQDGKTTVQLRDVRLYEVAPDGRLQAIAHAALAVHGADGWLLKDVLRTTFHERSVSQQRVAEERWESKLDAASLSANIARPRYMAARDLARSIEYRTRNGLDARDYEDSYWSRWFYAFNVLALCLAAIPFAFGGLRSGGLGKRLFLGILFALGFWVLQLLFSRMALAFKLDFRLAYALPSIVMLAVSAWLFRRRSR